MDDNNNGTFKEHILQQPLMLHIGAVLFLLWIASIFHVDSLLIFVIAFFILYQADQNYIQRTRRQVRYEERRSANQRRPLSDFETAQWLNQAIEKIWPIFLEKFVSQELLLPMIPWFVDKYKPWTARKAILQRLVLGRNPPIFTAIRTLDRAADDDHLVMDLGMDFLAADDMNALLAVQMRRRLGLGIWTSLHISKLHIEGKVRVGVKFLSGCPFLSRVRICFVNAPYVQMTVRPVSNHGVNVTELPGIAGWMDRMLADAFEQSLVEPNMLEIDVERLFASLTDFRSSDIASNCNWFQVHEKAPIAVAHVEVVEAADLKPSDLNGLADPFVKGALASFRFKTKIQKKTLKPKWQEEFRIPIANWELENVLVLHVRDKDQFRDDELGFCELDIGNFRGGQRHDLWLPLQDIKMGRLHLAVTVVENVSAKESAAVYVGSQESGYDDSQRTSSRKSLKSFPSSDLPDSNSNPPYEDSTGLDEYEAINMGKGENAFVSVMRPGKIVTKSWQQRKGKQRHDGAVAQREEVIDQLDMLDNGSSSEEEVENETPRIERRKRRLWNRRSSQEDKQDNKKGTSPTQRLANFNDFITVGRKGTTVRMKLEEANENAGSEALHELYEPMDNPGMHPFIHHESTKIPESPTTTKGHMKNMAKDFMKQAGKKAHSLGEALNRKGSSKEKSCESGKAEESKSDDLCVDPKGENAVSPIHSSEELKLTEEKT